MNEDTISDEGNLYDEAAAYDEDAIYNKWVNQSWPQARGIFTTDYNNSLVLVRASVEDVARYFAEDYKGARWERDVLGQQIVIGKEGLFIFRLQGHTYTEVLYHNDLYGSGHSLKRDYVQSLSRQLNARVISYYVSDTSGDMGYSLYKAGELLETLNQTGDDWDEDAIQAMADAGEEIPAHFHSTVREIDDRDLEDVYGFIYQFFLDQDANEPGITPDYFVQDDPRYGTDVQNYAGQSVKVQNPGFVLVVGSGREALSTPEFERVDYVALA